MRRFLAALFAVASLVLALLAGIYAAEIYTRADPQVCPHQQIEKAAIDRANRV
jgi:hypothetical protein